MAIDRRTPRVYAELYVQLVGARGEETFTSANVSRGGIFLLTETPRNERQLLRLRITLDPRTEPIDVHGIVVHQVLPAESARTGEPSGMGVEFIAFGGDPKARWEQFIDGLVTGSVTLKRRPSAASSSSSRQGFASGASETTRAVRSVFPIPIETPEQLYEVYERDFVAGVMFICTPEKLNVGDRVTVRIIHPFTRDEFDLHGKVQQVHDNPQYPGLSIALRPSTLQRREKFRAFIEEGLPEEDVDPY